MCEYDADVSRLHHQNEKMLTSPNLGAFQFGVCLQGCSCRDGAKVTQAQHRLRLAELACTDGVAGCNGLNAGPQNHDPPNVGSQLIRDTALKTPS